MYFHNISPSSITKIINISHPDFLSKTPFPLKRYNISVWNNDVHRFLFPLPYNMQSGDADEQIKIDIDVQSACLALNTENTLIAFQENSAANGNMSLQFRWFRPLADTWSSENKCRIRNELTTRTSVTQSRKSDFNKWITFTLKGFRIVLKVSCCSVSLETRTYLYSTVSSKSFNLKNIRDCQAFSLFHAQNKF